MNNKDKQVKYARMFGSGPVLELGSGRGDFLKVCRELNIAAVGVDSFPNAGDAGIKIIKKDIMRFLAAEKGRKYSGIYARHVVEHFEPDALKKIFSHAFRLIREDGVLILIFPNLRNIHVATFEFWNDITHVRPYTPEVISRLLSAAGFTVSVSQSDKESWDNSALKNFARFVRKLITGIKQEPPDYYIVAKKGTRVAD